MGRDAAALAAMGHAVLAVEPVDELRAAGRNLYPGSSVVWLDDSLPDLCLVRERPNTFDVVMITTVWMHLDEVERRRGMGTIYDRLIDGGVVILSLRHGPFPEGRRMFDVSAAETIELAESLRLKLLLKRMQQLGPARKQEQGSDLDAPCFWEVKACVAAPTGQERLFDTGP
ncbi:hypothetical protein NK8_66330 (plasmid) [Caballeronia sp. NK8]|uniref:methyltransferase domain-containing protein n=1 Tax=Caballeronia sp. NK8 TaxID=140098 RepID=UPI001BB63C11|nr:methyltransferase domain-containing protein [Caballeronia sp. NK8]BCQ28444.1 hypothetical protein NK8_66330 [Caballeronia sp. NK8]